MAERFIVVPRSHIAAARAQVARDAALGRQSDPRFIAIASAKPYRGPNAAAVARAVKERRQAVVVSATTGEIAPP